MEQQSVIKQKIDEAASRVKGLIQERDEALAASKALQKENDDMKAFLARTEADLEALLTMSSASANDEHERCPEATSRN